MCTHSDSQFYQDIAEDLMRLRKEQSVAKPGAARTSWAPDVQAAAAEGGRQRRPRQPTHNIAAGRSGEGAPFPGASDLDEELKDAPGRGGGRGRPRLQAAGTPGGTEGDSHGPSLYSPRP